MKTMILSGRRCWRCAHSSLNLIAWSSCAARRSVRILIGLATFFRVIVDILSWSARTMLTHRTSSSVAATRSERCSLPAASSRVIDSRTVVFPNYVRDFKNFYVYCLRRSRDSRGT